MAAFTVKKKLLFLLTLCVLGFFALEVGVRLFFFLTGRDINRYREFSFSRLPDKITVPDPELVYRLIPNICRDAFSSDFRLVYCTNSLGLREKEIGPRAGKFTVLFLGDSQTFGEGVPQGARFSDLLEKETEGIYSINAGVFGYGIHQMLAWLKRDGLALEPDLVIVALIPIDLYRAVYKKLEDMPHVFPGALTKESFLASEPPAGVFPQIDRMLSKSYAYSAAKFSVKLLYMSMIVRERDRRVWSELMKKNDDNQSFFTGRREKEIAREEAARIFRDLKETLAGRRIPFTVVNISTEPMPWLRALLAANAVEYLDLSAPMAAAGKITFDIDPHYNSAGHRFIADRLKEYLRGKFGVARRWR